MDLDHLVMFGEWDEWEEKERKRLTIQHIPHVHLDVLADPICQSVTFWR
jgi:hypothetical protein